MIEVSAYLTAFDSAKNGTTFVIDHHASPFFVEGSLEIMAKAFDKVGVSHLLCYEISDRDGKTVVDAGLQETENYLKTTPVLVGLHASFTLSDNTIKQDVHLPEKYNSGIHIHVAEDLFDQNHSLKNYEKRVVERLNDLGVFQFPKSILGHSLHINPDERAIIRKNKAWVVQNTESNLNNKVVFFKSDGLNKNKIMLGTDGMHSDMLRSAKTTFFVGQNFDTIDYLDTYQRFRNAHVYIQENNFDGDSDNNLVVLNYNNPTDFNQNNFLGHFIFGIKAKHIKHVISIGKIIVKNKKIVNIDEEGILKQAQELFKIL